MCAVFRAASTGEYAVDLKKYALFLIWPAGDRCRRGGVKALGSIAYRRLLTLFMLISHPARPDITYLFIDAGCLRSVVEKIGERYLGDKAGVTVRYDVLRGIHQKAFYYDAVPAREHGEEQHIWLERIDPQMAALNAIKSTDGFHAQLGDLRGRKARQKKVDVQIAVDMLLHTVRQNMERCTLIAGDIDFQPLLEALVREGMYVTLWHPDHAAEDLLNSADSCMALSPVSLKSCLYGPDGFCLMPENNCNIRPHDRSDVHMTWKVGTKQLEVSRLGHQWLVESYDPLASATSSYIVHPSLRVALAAAEDYWRIKVPSEVYGLEA
ncbi:NYN domain-containing protein [Sphingomonas sanguinis]|uniref:NYN domain-containing protein n=1 Tax=Sphingomonas sanguinis TaxID=33051 RepID=A0ABU5LVL3_9SPHN|nr:NYN domain-containing protein [Sphingomonas sanguinis]MDZ7283974.1 NYN domain-containing protein [Sphingomonas sanguinis]